MPLLDQFRHKPVEKCEKKRSDMRSVHIGIRHDNNPVVAQLRDIKVIVDPCSERRNHGTDLRVAVNPVKSRLLHIQDLSPERKDGLRRPGSRCLGTAACGISLYDKDLTVIRILVRAVRKLAGKTHTVQSGLSSCKVPGLSRRVPCPLGHHGLLYDHLSCLGMLLQIDRQLVCHN